MAIAKNPTAASMQSGWLTPSQLNLAKSQVGYCQLNDG